jgi:hypothetical protein
MLIKNKIKKKLKSNSKQIQHRGMKLRKEKETIKRIKKKKPQQIKKANQNLQLG